MDIAECMEMSQEPQKDLPWQSAWKVFGKPQHVAATCMHVHCHAS